EGRCAADGAVDGSVDVVELQVQENGPTELGDARHGGRPRAHEELETHLEDADVRSHPLGKITCALECGEVERKSQALAPGARASHERHRTTSLLSAVAARRSPREASRRHPPTSFDLRDRRTSDRWDRRRG